MKLEQVKEIANAVLYEGYLLYPYRQSAIKNRQRWTFGVVYPQDYSRASGEIEPWFMRTECLLKAPADARLDVHVRFLHLLMRSTVENQSGSETESPAPLPAWQITSTWQPESWEEGIEREMSIPGLALADLLIQPAALRIAFPARRLAETREKESTQIIREQSALAGAVIVAAEAVAGEHKDCYKISVQIENHTTGTGSPEDQRSILLQSFVSTHTIVHLASGEIISLFDPPPELASQVQECQNQRTWPVLVGKGGERDTVLSSPIILYDYPQIAPESIGALFDGTEIDEILTLRILTLTDEEKTQIRQGDSRAREILERTEALSPEQFMQLHGTVRKPGPSVKKEPAGEAFPVLETLPSSSGSHRAAPGMAEEVPEVIVIAGQKVQRGSRVRLHPSARADAFDFLLRDKTARVELIQQDYERRLYLVVTLDDDPGREQWDERIMPGHRFFFFPDEVEPLAEAGG
jgi:hypothetical protein